MRMKGIIDQRARGTTGNRQAAAAFAGVLIIEILRADDQNKYR